MAVPREITRIEVPEPEPMHPTPDGGAETQGAAYRLSAPAVATEPLAVTAPDGTALTWVPTELCYRDEKGQMDYIVGSAPATVQVRDREARYQRTFPVADDVFLAEAERVKHWVILHEPPRGPAEYLSGAIEFGITGVVSGVVLPEGRHDEIQAGPLQLPRPMAKDLSGREVKGYYEVLTAEDGQQLYVWFPACAIREAVYPVTIDPTVVIADAFDATDASTRAIARTPDGTLYVLIKKPTAPYLAVYRSTDRGLTWEDTACPGLSGLTFYFCIVATDDGRVHVFAPEGGQMQHMIYDGQAWTKQAAFSIAGGFLTAMDATPVGNDIYLVNVSRLEGAGYSLWLARYNGTSWTGPTRINVQDNWMMDCAIAVSGSTIVVIYAGNDNKSNFYWTVAAVSTNGGSSFTRYLLNTTINTRLVSACATGNGEIYVAYSVERTDFVDEIYCRKWAGSWGSAVQLAAGDGNLSALHCVSSGPSDVYVVWSGNIHGTFHYGVYYRAFVGGVWESRKTLVNPVNNIENRYSSVPPSAPDKLDIPVVWTRQEGGAHTVMYTSIDREDPPNAPILWLRANFDATEDAVFTWQFSDPDPGDSQTAYQLLITRADDGSVVYDTGKVASSTQQHTLPAGTLANGVQYRWTVRTWDRMDMAGPYATEQSFLTSGKPSLTITNPASDGATVATSSYTVQWAMSDPEGKGQSAYQVVLKDNDGNVVYDSGKVPGTTDREHTLLDLQNNTTYTVEVTVWDGDDVASDTAVRTFQVQYTPPPVPDVTIEALEAWVRITIANHNAGAEVEAISNDVYRRKAGETGSGIRIAAGVPVDAVIEDYVVASGVTYEYRVVAFGVNGTISTSPWVRAPVLHLAGTWLHDPADPPGTLRQYRVAANPQRGEDWEPERALLQFTGRSLPVAEFGEHEDQQVHCTILILPDRLDDLDALRALAARRSVVCYRDSAGRRIYGVLGPLRIRDERHGGYTVDLEITAVDYDEAV